MNELKIFENAEFGQIRTVKENGEPMFCLVDICKALEISNARMTATRLDEDEVRKFDLRGQVGETNFVTESGLYAVILRSDKPNAKKFRKWVTSEVLPSIRKNGVYGLKGSASDSIRLLAQGHMELEQKVDEVKYDLDSFRDTLPLLALDCDVITKAVRVRGIKCLGGKSSNAYHDTSLRSRVYSDIHGEVKRQFGVTTYKALRRNQVEQVVELIKKYSLPIVLEEDVTYANAQSTIAV